MARHPNLIATVAPLALMVAGPLPAQEEAKRPWQLQTDFGLVNTAGNTSTTTLNAGERGSYQTGAWTFAQQFSVVYGETDGRKSAESYRAVLRGDHALTKRVGLYVLGAWDRNRFAGVARRFEEGGGFSFKAIAGEETTLSLEAGLGGTQQRDLAGTSRSFVTGRGALLLKQMLNDRAYVQQLAEVLPNLKQSDDVRIESETALVAPLSSHIALKAGYVVHFDNRPEPGFEKTDRFLTSGLQVVF